MHYKRGKNMKTDKSEKNRKPNAKVWLAVLFGALLIGMCNACSTAPAEESGERSMPVTEDVAEVSDEMQVAEAGEDAAVILPEAEAENEVTKEAETTTVETAAPTPEPTNTPAPTAEPDDERTVIPTGTDYILNTNTKKFHYTWCSSVDQMKEKNKSYYTGTRDEVIGMGYDPCGRCKP